MILTFHNLSMNLNLPFVIPSTTEKPSRLDIRKHSFSPTMLEWSSASTRRLSFQTLITVNWHKSVCDAACAATDLFRFYVVGLQLSFCVSHCNCGILAAMPISRPYIEWNSVIGICRLRISLVCSQFLNMFRSTLERTLLLDISNFSDHLKCPWNIVKRHSNLCIFKTINNNTNSNSF